MQIEQTFRLPLAPDVVWPAFQDVRLLVSCLPGAALTGEEQESGWPLRFDVKLGPIAATFAGNGRLEIEASTKSGRFEGQASDRKTQSRVKGKAAFSLHSEDGGTRVQVQLDYALSGALAQFGRAGIVKEIAAGLSEQFAKSLQSQLMQSQLKPERSDLADAMPMPPSTTPSHSIPVTQATAPISLGRVIAGALRRWLAGLLKRDRHQP